MSYQKVLLWLYSVVLVFYLVFSFAYTDPNLVFSYNRYFLDFQKTMWNFGLENRLESSLTYMGLILVLFLVYWLILQNFKAKKIGWQQLKRVVLIAIGILLLANPALSHDIYNYLFNAKMVWLYKANPHVQVALNFSQDKWTRLMHNTHTPAPYGYGWTGLSLIPSLLGFNRLKLSLLLFKLFVGGFFVWLIFLQEKLSKQLKIKNTRYLLAVFMLNPLVLIETFGNGHNDVVMMALAMLAMDLGLKAMRERKIRFWVGSFVALGLSVSIKFASIVLLPVMLGYWLIRKLRLRLSLGTMGGGVLLTPLVTVRSQRFLPWYLIWSMSLIPIMKEGWMVKTLVVASLAGMLGYVPFLIVGDYTSDVLLIRGIISFGLPLGYLVISWLYKKYGRKSV